jgi:hypothetical protein
MADKKILDEISEWVDKNSKKTKQDIYVSAFLAIKEEVDAALERGYSSKAIWGFYHEKGSIKCTYQTFLNHVNKYIKDVASNNDLTAETKLEETSNTEEEQDNLESSPTTLQQDVETEVENKGKEPTGFNFDPNPNKEDLI